MLPGGPWYHLYFHLELAKRANSGNMKSSTEKKKEDEDIKYPLYACNMENKVTKNPCR